MTLKKTQCVFFSVMMRGGPEGIRTPMPEGAQVTIECVYQFRHRPTNKHHIRTKTEHQVRAASIYFIAFKSGKITLYAKARRPSYRKISSHNSAVIYGDFWASALAEHRSHNRSRKINFECITQARFDTRSCWPVGAMLQVCQW